MKTRGVPTESFGTSAAEDPVPAIVEPVADPVPRCPAAGHSGQSGQGCGPPLVHHIPNAR